MRDCKCWMHLPHINEYDRTVSTMILQDTIKREARGAKTRAELCHRCDIMKGNLHGMFVDGELAPRTYTHLNSILLSEFRKCYEALNE